MGPHENILSVNLKRILMGNAELGDFIRLNHGRSALPYVHPQTSSHLQAYSQHHESKTPYKKYFPSTMWIHRSCTGAPSAYSYIDATNIRYPMVGLHLLGPCKILKEYSDVHVRAFDLNSCKVSSENPTGIEPQTWQTEGTQFSKRRQPQFD